MGAAVAAVSIIEDILVFNSGKGAVFNSVSVVRRIKFTPTQNELKALSRPLASHPHIPSPSSCHALSLTLLT
ncbi:hypothetical protein BJV78DRAFT_1285938 [Lactifluus subvellereus]|nr:hypothetical protein BJV78DRAFT_1285938 [Lactifluus subvellereus]